MTATKLHAGVLATFVMLTRHHVLAQNYQTDVNSSYVDPIFHTQDCWVPPGVPIGCWFEGSRGPRLLGGSSYTDPDSMSVELCADFCTVTNNYTLFGVEFGQECYCGDHITAGAGFPIPDISQCNMNCVGNSDEKCGGYGAIYLYQALPSVPPLPPGLTNNFTYTPIGCYAEPSDGTRALPDFVLVSVQQSAETCSTICGHSDYPFFGLEYADECWCGTALSLNATPVSTSRCNMPCVGNTSETCGGPGLLNVYEGTLVNDSVPIKHRPYHPMLRKGAQVPVFIA